MKVIHELWTKNLKIRLCDPAQTFTSPVILEKSVRFSKMIYLQDHCNNIEQRVKKIIFKF